MDIETQHIEQIVAYVWESTLQLPVEFGDAPAAIGTTFRASVEIEGEWGGRVTLIADAAFAACAARLMFALGADDEATADDLRDALGELANMVGGNVKALCPAPSRLTLPVVEETDDVRALTAAIRVAFACDGHPLSVEIAAVERAVAAAR